MQKSYYDYLSMSAGNGQTGLLGGIALGEFTTAFHSVKCMLCMLMAK